MSVYTFMFNTLSTVGDRAFPVAAARVWNSRPEHGTSEPSVAVFRPNIRTCPYILYRLTTRKEKRIQKPQSM